MKRKVSSIAAILIIASICIPIITADASVTTIVAGTAGCYAGARLSQAATDAIKEGEFNLVYNLKDGPLKDFLANFFGIFEGGVGGVIGGTVPVSDQSLQQSLSKYIGIYTDKNFSQNVIAKCISREIIRSLVNGTENIIKTQGRDGGAAYIKNWNNFETSA